MDTNIVTDVEKVFAGIDVNTIPAAEPTEDAGGGPWNVVPNRQTRRQYARLHGVEKPLRSRTSRKRGRR